MSKKPQRNDTSKNGLICQFFQEGTCKFATYHRTAGQFLDISVRHVMVYMSHVSALRKWLQKTRCPLQGCSGETCTRKMFSDRYVYNTGFVNSELFHSMYVDRLLSIPRHVHPLLTFAEVLKRNSEGPRWQSGNTLASHL